MSKNSNRNNKDINKQNTVTEKNETIIASSDENTRESNVRTKREQVKIDPDKTAALYTLWFGLDYGSILTAYALYEVTEQCGLKPVLLEKHPDLWSDHYAEKNNIAGKFIYSNCDVLDVFSDKDSAAVLPEIKTHIIGSDVLWDNNIVGRQTDKYYYLSDINGEGCTKITYGTTFAGHNVEIDKRNDYRICINKFKAVSVKSLDESIKMADMYYTQPEIVIDPVFLCDKENYVKCTETSVAKEVETENSFIFTYMKNGNARKKDFVLRGNKILMEKYVSPLRNFIDINRYPESKAAIGLDPAFHILVNDWLYYIINSDFVITDDYYGMCFAILFEKNFAVLVNRDTIDLSLYTTLLEQLGLSERLVFTDDDFRAKEYLFRKPIRYNGVNEKLDKIRTDSLNWLKKNLG